MKFIDLISTRSPHDDFSMTAFYQINGSMKHQDSFKQDDDESDKHKAKNPDHRLVLHTEIRDEKDYS